MYVSVWMDVYVLFPLCWLAEHMIFHVRLHVHKWIMHVHTTYIMCIHMCTCFLHYFIMYVHMYM